MEKKVAIATVALIVVAVAVLLLAMLRLPDILDREAIGAAVLLLIIAVVFAWTWRLFFIKKRGYSQELDQEKNLQFFLDFPPGSFKGFEDRINHYFLCREKGRLCLRHAPQDHVDNLRKPGEEYMQLSVDRDGKWRRIVLASSSVAALEGLEEQREEAEVS